MEKATNIKNEGTSLFKEFNYLDARLRYMDSFLKL
jgi:hypothetical protein